MNPSKENPQHFHCLMSLTAGTYQYKFLVNGEWMYDKKEMIQSDGFGGFNNKVTIIPKVLDP